MTQQPNRPTSIRGAVDLSGLARQSAAPAPAGAPAGGAPAGGSSYSVDVTEQNFQEIVEASLTAPVLLAFYSPSRMPESAAMADDLRVLSDEFEGRFLVGCVDIDTAPAVAQAVQLPSVPYVFAVVDGRPAPLLADIAPIDQLRTALTQISQQLTVSGVSGRHQPRRAASADGEPAEDPRYVPAQDALAAGDVDGAIAEYQKLVDANPADAEAAAGLAMASLLKRTQGVDLNAARAAAAANPDDIAAQTLVADLDLLGGHVDDAFDRLVELVRRTAGDERNQAREHLIALFGAVGNEDPRVLRARQNLASALF